MAYKTPKRKLLELIQSKIWVLEENPCCKCSKEVKNCAGFLNTKDRLQKLKTYQLQVTNASDTAIEYNRFPSALIGSIKLAFPEIILELYKE
jgi:hypothetical protein